MIPIVIRAEILGSIKNVIDLRLLRGEVPWSLAGTDGNRREKNLQRRGELVARISTAISPSGWSAEIAAVRSEAGRANKLELVLTSPSGEQEVWTW